MNNNTSNKNGTSIVSLRIYDGQTSQVQSPVNTSASVGIKYNRYIKFIGCLAFCMLLAVVGYIASIAWRAYLQHPPKTTSSGWN